MSNLNFAALNTPEGYKAFLQAYHGQLVEQRSFPPLGLQKSLHTAAPIFGFNDWNTMSAALQQSVGESAFDYPERYMLKNGSTHFEYVLGERYDALLDAYKRVAANAPEQATADNEEPEQIQVVVITVIELDGDSDSPRHTDTKVVRSWQKAKEHITNLAFNKVMHNGRSVADIMDCHGINLPNEDDFEDFDNLDERELMDWIVENNDLDDLIALVSYLDFNLTKITTNDSWI
jgi:hypothetical protein